jgi:hypothetical protein
MTSHTTARRTPKDCIYCSHELDAHELALLIRHPVPGGIVTCPASGCTCRATWATVDVGAPDAAELRKIAIRRIGEALRREATRTLN